MTDASSIRRASDACRASLPESFPITIGVILGSGLGASADRFLNDGAKAIRYDQIPCMPKTHVVGHAGRLVVGQFGDVRVAMLQGRSHFYEGHDPETVTFATQLLAALGMSTLVVTNAAGGIRSTFQPGDLMLIEDHLRPLAAVDLAMHHVVNSPTDDLMSSRVSAIDGCNLWNAELRTIAGQIDSSLRIHSGTYAMMTGPTYETAAEIRTMRHLGADAVGMSTVPEAIAAASLGVKVLGVSCITNVAAGLSDKTLDHHEVTATASSVETAFVDWLWRLIPRISAATQT